MVGDHLKTRGQHLISLVIQADRGAGQIVQQGVHAIMEQRHPVLHARMAAAVGDGQINRIGSRILAEQVPPAGAEAGDAVFAQRHFRNRPQDQFFPFAGASLAGGIEHLDGLDGVAEHIEAYRFRLPGREDIHDPAAHGVFARLHHGAGAAITVGLQERRQHFRFYRPAGLQLQAGIGEHRAGRHALHQRIDGGEHDARLGRRFQQPRQGGDPLGHQRRIGRNPVVWQAVPGRKPQNLDLRGEERQRFGQARHPGIVAHDVQYRAG